VLAVVLSQKPTSHLLCQKEETPEWVQPGYVAVLKHPTTNSTLFQQFRRQVARIIGVLLHFISGTDEQPSPQQCHDGRMYFVAFAIFTELIKQPSWQLHGDATHSEEQQRQLRLLWMIAFYCSMTAFHCGSRGKQALEQKMQKHTETIFL